MCPDCKQTHVSFDNKCLIYLKYILVNTVMAYCNVSQFIAKRLIKKKNISNKENTCMLNSQYPELSIYQKL